MNRAATIEVHSTLPRARFRRDFLAECVRRAIRHSRRPFSRLSIVVIGDRQMARLHREFQGIRGTTDVLTFDLSENRKSPIDGEVYVCLEQARRQCRDYSVPLYHEMARLAVHGVLHLAGLDDHTDPDRARMTEREDLILLAAARKLRPRPTRTAALNRTGTAA